MNLPLIFDIATGKFYLDSAAGKYNELELPGESAYPDEEYTEQADNWSWDPDTKTLTLSDFHYKVSGALSGYGANKLEPGDPMGFRGIRAPALIIMDSTMPIENAYGDSINIVLEGDNSLEGPTDCVYYTTAGLWLEVQKTTFSGSGSLTLQGGTGHHSQGLFVWAGATADTFVTINNTDIKAYGGTASSYPYVYDRELSVGIIMSGNLILNGGTLDAVGGPSGDDSKGINLSTGEIIVNDGVLNASSSDVIATEGADLYGLAVGGHSNAITNMSDALNPGNTSALNEVPTYGGTVTVNGGELNAIGGTVYNGKQSGNPYCFSAGIIQGYLIVNGGTVNSSAYAYGAYITHSTIVNDGSANIQSNGYGLVTLNTVEVSDGTLYVSGYSAGIYIPSNDLIFTQGELGKGEITVISSTSALYQTVGLNLPQYYQYWTNTAATDEGAQHFTVIPDADLSNKATYKFIRIRDFDPYVSVAFDPNYPDDASGSSDIEYANQDGYLIGSDVDVNFTYVPDLPIKNGGVYEFAGWATTVDGAVEFVQNDTTTLTNISEDATFYAVWTWIPDVYYTVSFDPNYPADATGEGQITYANQDGYLKGSDVDVDLALPFEAPEKEGGHYEFAGWALVPDGVVIYQEDDQITIHGITQDTTYYAVWQWVDDVYYQVNFDPNYPQDASGTSKITPANPDGYLKGSNPEITFDFIPFSPVKTGGYYTFAGWAESEEGTPLYSYGDIVEIHAIDSDKTYYAIWTWVANTPAPEPTPVYPDNNSPVTGTLDSGYALPLMLLSMMALLYIQKRKNQKKG
ncbi:MAG: InlB B-repeat-containing protein [Erysipelotrichaceae bacterium]|nr:InlB B-repeat-containing protein [Erysipelotrichaceae bacterium]